MDPESRPSSASSNERLINELEGVLGASMGVRIPFTEPVRKGKPLWWALGWLAVYSLACGAVIGWNPSSQPKLFSLLVWAGFFFAGAIYFARSTTAQVFEIIRSAILPFASEAYVDAVREDLRGRYGPARLIVLPLVVATLCLPAALWAIGNVLGTPIGISGPLHSPALLLWAATYFIFFLAAARSVIASRFYRSFADHLEKEQRFFYVLGAADTPLVKGLAKLSSQVLTFLAFIFLLLASGMLLAAIPWDRYALDAGSWLLLLMVPTSCFFSLGFGSVVYLNAESKIRRTLLYFTLKRAADLQEESNRILYSSNGFGRGEQEELERLAKLQDRILAGGRYGSRIGAAVSITLPLIMPVIGLIIEAFRNWPVR